MVVLAILRAQNFSLKIQEFRHTALSMVPILGYVVPDWEEDWKRTRKHLLLLYSGREFSSLLRKVSTSSASVKLHDQKAFLSLKEFLILFYHSFLENNETYLLIKKLICLAGFSKIRA